MRVDVYRNLNRDCLSVKCMEPGHDEYGTLISHEERVGLFDVMFVVQPSGRETARERGAKNVHAFARGERKDIGVVSGEPVTYDPFRFDRFVHEETHEPVERATHCLVTTDGILAKGLTYHSDE